MLAPPWSVPLPQGVPQPNITWRREDGKPIYRDVQRSNGVRLDKGVFQGEYLDLQVLADTD